MTKTVMDTLLNAVDGYTLDHAGDSPTVRWLNGLKQAIRDAYPQVQIHYADEWAAVYVDGQLDTNISVGDAHNRNEAVFALFGVEQVVDEAFMRGQDQSDGVARTLDEITAYTTVRDERKARIAALRAEADKLEGRG
jgi:hypothetical protein